MNTIRIPILTTILPTGLLFAEGLPTGPDDLYTTEGSDPGVEELVRSGAIVPGQQWQHTLQSSAQGTRP